MPAMSSDSRSMLPACSAWRQELLLMLGPDLHQLRVTQRSFRGKDFDLLREVLRWLCVNEPCILAAAVSGWCSYCPELFPLGCVPVRCSNCHEVHRTRHMYRVTRKSGIGRPAYICCYCTASRVEHWLGGESDDLFQGATDDVRVSILMWLHGYIKIAPTATMGLFHRCAAAMTQGGRTKRRKTLPGFLTDMRKRMGLLPH